MLSLRETHVAVAAAIEENGGLDFFLRTPISAMDRIIAMDVKRLHVGVNVGVIYQVLHRVRANKTLRIP